MVSEATCIDALHRAATNLGTTPTKAEYEDLGYTPAAATIIRTFGSWNAAKEAASLDTHPSTGERVGPMPEDAPFTEREWKELTADQRWHYRHTDHNTQRTLDRRARLRAWVYNSKRDADGCDRCEETDPACLDFHHRNPDEKFMAIGEMVSYGYGKDELQAEMAKCDLLCANCHRIEHYELPRGVEPLTSD